MDNFNAHKWFKKQYLAEDKSDEDKVVAKGDGIEITQKQMERLQKGYPVRLSNGSVLASPFVKEGHTEDKMRNDQTIQAYERLTDDDKLKLMQIKAMLDKEKLDQSKSSSLIGRMGNRSLKENMSPGEAVTELNFLMDELQNLSGEVKQIMRQTFPDEYTRGDAYGAFDFGSSRNQYDTTFESILDSLASVGDDME